MSTTYPTPTSHEIEPTTVAVAWAASPLGEPTYVSTEPWDGDTEGTKPAAKPTSVARHALVVAALACGIGLGAALGVTVFDSTETTQPIVMVPQVKAPVGGPTGPAQALTEQHLAPTPEHPPLPQPPVAASQGAPVFEGAPAAADPSSSDTSSPAVVGPSHPAFTPPSSGNPGDPPMTVDIDVPQLPQPQPADPQKPGPTIELGPASELPALKPQVPPTLTLLPPKSRWTLNESVQKPPKVKRGVPATKPSQRNTLAKTGTAGDE